MPAIATYESRTITVRIERPLDEVYDFVYKPDNFPKWASGLSTTLEKLDGQWVADTPAGKVKIHFSEWNPFGVVDHIVVPKMGPEIHIPLRAIRNGEGTEVIFTLLRYPGVSDEHFSRDIDWVTRDLHTLKKLLETS